MMAIQEDKLIATSTSHYHLLHLEPDGLFHLVHLVDETLRVRDQGGELAGLAETGTQETWDLLNETVRGEECIVLLGYGINYYNLQPYYCRKLVCIIR